MPQKLFQEVVVSNLDVFLVSAPHRKYPFLLLSQNNADVVQRHSPSLRGESDRFIIQARAYKNVRHSGILDSGAVGYKLELTLREDDT
jgi:hypothetical protein